MRAILAFATAVILTACTSGPPNGPSPPPPPPPPPPSEGESFFLVGGWVADSGSRLLSGVTVRVVSGEQAGVTATTDEKGRYDFDRPLEHNALLHASKPGYVDETRLVTQAATVGGTRRLDFQLRSPNGHVDLTGHHTITFTADSSCTNLPAAIRTRTYLANITRGLAGLYGARFHGHDYMWRTMYVNQFEDYASFMLTDPPIWELLPDDSYVSLFGHASGTVTANASTLAFWGSINYCPRMIGGESPTCAVAEIACQSSTHQMTVERR